MKNIKSIGRIVGVLTFGQVAIGILVNFVLLSPMSAQAGFLRTAFHFPTLIAASAVLGIIVGMLSVTIAAVVFSLARQFQHQGALISATILLTVSAASIAVSAVEQINLMSMLSLSESYAKASNVDLQTIELMSTMVATTRNWSHYIALMIGGAMILMLYSTFLQLRLVPRMLAILGVLAAMLQIVAVSMPLFGHQIILLMIAPIGIVQIVLAFWLIVKGFREPTINRL
jgi:hypothetical protein